MRNSTKRQCLGARLRVGARVVSRDLGSDDHAVRVVIGRKPDGRCMTMYEAPLPWMPSRFYLEDEADLVEFERPLELVQAG